MKSFGSRGGPRLWPPFAVSREAMLRSGTVSGGNESEARNAAPGPQRRELPRPLRGPCALAVALRARPLRAASRRTEQSEPCVLLGRTCWGRSSRAFITRWTVVLSGTTLPCLLNSSFGNFGHSPYFKGWSAVLSELGVFCCLITLEHSNVFLYERRAVSKS